MFRFGVYIFSQLIMKIGTGDSICIKCRLYFLNNNVDTVDFFKWTDFGRYEVGIRLP